jgi:hypothetical protein
MRTTDEINASAISNFDDALSTIDFMIREGISFNVELLEKMIVTQKKISTVYPIVSHYKRGLNRYK